MKTLRTLLVALAPVFTASTLAATDPLEAGFRNPPDSAKPHTWWHWMNGNITREGITADLEAMKRVGVGGAQIFNVDSGIPHGPVQFMSPEWRALFKHAVVGSGPPRDRTLRSQLRRLVEQRRTLEHSRARDAESRRRRSARPRAVFLRRRIASAGNEPGVLSRHRRAGVSVARRKPSPAGRPAGAHQQRRRRRWLNAGRWRRGNVRHAAGADAREAAVRSARIQRTVRRAGRDSGSGHQHFGCER